MFNFEFDVVIGGIKIVVNGNSFILGLDDQQTIIYVAVVEGEGELVYQRLLHKFHIKVKQFIGFIFWHIPNALSLSLLQNEGVFVSFLILIKTNK
jgi:hypothetical protein